MSEMHDHHHDHAAPAGDRRLLALASALLLAFMAAEVSFGIARRLAGAPRRRGPHAHRRGSARARAPRGLGAARPAGGRWTFGFGRAEILAAQANGVALLLFGRLDPLRGDPPASRPARGRGG